jgi:hypothetical protein
VAIGRELTGRGRVGRWSTVQRRGDRPPLRTAAGRRVLRRLRAEPPAPRAFDGGSAVLVALHGRGRMGDALLRASIFEAFPTPTAKERAASFRRRMDATRWDASYQGRGGGLDAGGGVGGGDGGGG